MNGGMYGDDRMPVGLYIEDGRMMKAANTASGRGNFHLKPNGVFYAAGESAGVLETGRYLAARPRAEIATQSGPMLVIDGRIHPAFSEDSTSRKLRNGVGVRQGQVVLFAISDAPVTFIEFAHLFKDGLGCRDALFLDGSVSSLYAPSLGRSDGLAPLGPIIGAVERRGPTASNMPKGGGGSPRPPSARTGRLSRVGRKLGRKASAQPPARYCWGSTGVLPLRSSK